MIHSSPFPDIDLPEGSVYDVMFDGLSEEDAHRPAITELTTGNTVTYGELKEKADAVAGELAERGIGPGHTVSLQIPNSIDFAAALLGIFRAGATVNPIGVLMTAEDVQKIADMAGADLFIGISDVGHGNHIWREDLAKIYAKQLTPPNIEVDPDSIAAVPFSSGTTGLPKGVLLSHRNLTANMAQTRVPMRANNVFPFTKSMAPLPFAHIYGMATVLLLPLWERWHIHTMPKFDLEVFLRAHCEHQLEFTYVAPPMAVALAKHPLVDPALFKSSRVILSGAAPLDTETARAVERRLGVDVIQGFGMTEASPVTHTTIIGKVDPGAIGLALPNTEFRVVDIETLEDLPQGETGEMLIRGPQVMQGYLNNEEATRETLVDGWLRTGDVARIDENGHTFIVDRAKEVIKYKGYQVPPAELEALLLTHDAIADAGVVGVDKDGLEIPRAFIVLQKGAELTEQEVIDWVAERVTPYKKVRAVEFIDEIPKNPSGKILRKDLRLIPLEG